MLDRSTPRIAATLSPLLIVFAAAFMLAACTVSVDKRQQVVFEEQVTFPQALTFTGDGDGNASAERAVTQRGPFNFVGEWASDTQADLEQAIRAGLQANLPMQGSTVNATTNDTGGATTSPPPPDALPPPDPDPAAPDG